MNKLKKAIVFSGGGARACAFLGVFRVLERIGQEFEIIGGTSAGSLFAAMWAAGYTADEITQTVREISDNQALIKDINWREIAKFIGSGFRSHHLKSILKGHKLASYIEKKLHQKNIRKLGDFKKHYFCLATDIDREEEVLISSATHPALDAHLSALASATIPAIFPPVCIDGRCLVDGSCKTNYPVLPAISLGAEEVWVVYLKDVEREVNSTIKNGIFDIIKQTIDSVVHDQVEGDIERARNLIGAENVHLFPITLPESGILDFSKSGVFADAGEKQFEEMAMLLGVRQY